MPAMAPVNMSVEDVHAAAGLAGLWRDGPQQLTAHDLPPWMAVTIGARGLRFRAISAPELVGPVGQLLGECLIDDLG